MARLNLTLLLMLGCGCLSGGCASFAKQTPTPAAEISPREAAAMKAPPEVRYYVLVFGSESRPRRPKYTHSWATLVKVTGEQSD
jgi:hypothetical protein